MKKELLIASALISTMGVASVAEAVTATMSGSHKTGLKGTDTDANADSTVSHLVQSNFTVSLAETTDGGVGIATSFMLTNESSAGGTHTAGLTLTFTDGSKLDLMKAGNAAASHDVSVPGGAGEAGVTITSSNNAQTGLDFFAEATAIGIEWHSAADFMADGLKVGASISVDDGAAPVASVALESGWGVGATYVTTAGDTTVTVGGGYANSEYKDLGTDPSSPSNGFHVGFSAVTGNLTVAAAYASGDDVKSNPDEEIADATVSKMGVKYVAGDITLSVGYSSGEAKDNANFGTAGTTVDAKDVTDAGISYAVASGVTANLGWQNADSKDEGASDTSGGTSWYIGASMSF
jgi:hypothetical protein